MNLDQIFELWEQDSKIDRSELGNASVDIPKLHHKYYKIFSKERLKLRKLESELKELRAEKREFYLDGPTQEQVDKGWKLPPKGKILRTDVDHYIEADTQIVEMVLKIAYQREKVDLVDSILNTIKNMSFHINNAIRWEEFKVGK